VTILLNFIHPNLIAPFFNEFKQLANRDVSLHLKYLAEKVKFPLKNIKWNNSRSVAAHSNAYFYGFGQTKVIVLHDTLLTKLNPKEITSVVCHEMGHWAYSHPFKKLFVYLVEVWSIFYIFSFFLQNEEVFLSFGFREKSVIMG
jgi:STE24 endopeptidase